MILFARSIGIAKGQNAGAVTQAKALAEYLNANMGIELNVCVPIGGNPQRIVFTSSYDSLARVEEVMEKMAADGDFQALVAKGLDYFVEGTMEDRLLKVV